MDLTPQIQYYYRPPGRPLRKYSVVALDRKLQTAEMFLAGSTREASREYFTHEVARLQRAIRWKLKLGRFNRLIGMEIFNV